MHRIARIAVVTTVAAGVLGMTGSTAYAAGPPRVCPEGYYGVIIEDPKGTPVIICIKP
jgi:hypothetical protein